MSGYRRLFRTRFAECLTPPDGTGRLVTRIEREVGRRLNEGDLANLDLRGDIAELRSATGLEGRVDLAKGEGRLLVGGERIEAALENYLRMINAILILERGGIHLHSAGVVRDGRGYAFFGPADAGKSTTAGFSSGFHVLSDDQNVLLPNGDGVTLWGIPFRSALCPVQTAPGTAPLAALLRLHQDGQDALEAVPTGQAVALLASQCPFVNFQPELVGRLMENCERIVTRVPMQIMHFAKGPDFWNIL